MSKFLTLCFPSLVCGLSVFCSSALGWFDESQTTSDSAGTAEIEGFEWKFPAMGTEMSLQTFTDQPDRLEAIFLKARQEADRVTAILTDYDDESETMQLSAAGRINQWHSVSDELWTVLNEADRWHGLSDGKFDSSIGSLTSMWRRARKSKRWPTDDQITEARQHSGWQYVKLDEAQRKCMITQDGLKLDFGAVAKGYIVDRVFQVLVDAGLSQSVVRAGGDIRVGDAPPGRDGWRVMVGPIAGEADSLKFVTMRNCAIATSGDLWQFIEVNGVRRSHIVDPTTGIGIEGPISASAIAPTSMQADAAATTFCLLGHQRGAALAEELPGFEAMIVSQSTDPNRGLRYTTTTGFSYPAAAVK